MTQEVFFDELKEKMRFYISTPERAAEALLFIRRLETVAAKVKDKVKARAVEVMDREDQEKLIYTITDQETGEIREWSVTRDYGKEMKEYRPEQVVRAFGQEASLKFFKVSKSKLDAFLKQASAKKEISMQQVETAVSDPIITYRKGAGVILREIKS